VLSVEVPSRTASRRVCATAAALEADEVREQGR
jgi:hypothetical protein